MKKSRISNKSKSLEKGVGSSELTKKEKVIVEKGLIPIMDEQGVFAYIKEGELQVEYKNPSTQSKKGYSFFLSHFIYRNGVKHLSS